MGAAERNLIIMKSERVGSGERGAWRDGWMTPGLSGRQQTRGDRGALFRTGVESETTPENASV